MTDHNKRLKLCVKWFQRVDEGHLLEEERLRNSLESVEKKCLDTGKYLLSNSNIFLSFHGTNFLEAEVTLNMDSCFSKLRKWIIGCKHL